MANRYVYIAQRGKCFYCGVPMHSPGEKEGDPKSATRDHVFPRSRYPERHGNIVWCCLSCNQNKADREPTFKEVCKLGALKLMIPEFQSAVAKVKA